MDTPSQFNLNSTVDEVYAAMSDDGALAFELLPSEMQESPDEFLDWVQESYNAGFTGAPISEWLTPD